MYSTTGGPQYTDAGGFTSPQPTMPGEDGDDSTTDPGPIGPGCSVQVVTQGALMEPLDKGEEAGKFPTIVGDALEDQCGCHTLQSNGQNIEFEFLKAPGGSLFTTLADMDRSFEGGTLGESMSFQVIGNQAMPPGSCSFPADDEAVLSKWFNDGLPDGATFVWP